MASNSICDICLRRNKTSVAVKFCSDCEDKLCTECADVHGMFKAFVSHHVVDVNLVADKSFEIKKTCSKHTDMILDFYCSDDDVLCCRSCMADEHRACRKLLPLEVAAKDVRKSVIFGDIFADVEQLNKVAYRLTDVKGEFSSVLDGSKFDVKRKISNLTEKLFESIKEIESNCLSEVDTVYAKLSLKIKDTEKNVESRIKAIHDISRRFELVTKHGSESQIFLFLNSIQNEISKTSKDLEVYVPILKFPVIDFKEEDFGHQMKSLGLVTEKENACNIKYTTRQSQQAQIIQMMGHTPTKFVLEKKVSFEGDGFTDICATRDNRIILCQGSNLLVLTDEGKHLQKITLSKYSWGIAIPTDSDEAWITMRDCNYIQVINIQTCAPCHQVTVPESRYRGIAAIEDRIALGYDGQVDIINKKGVVLKSLKVGNGTIYSLCAARSDTNKLYCCETDRSRFHCINMDGSTVFTYTSLEYPIGVITDSHGNFYVFDYRKNKLHRFSDDGKPKGVILTQKDGLHWPYSMAFNHSFSKMFVPNRTDGNIHIFSCTY